MLIKGRWIFEKPSMTRAGNRSVLADAYTGEDRLVRASWRHTATTSSHRSIRVTGVASLSE